jgi:hypoxanthine-guanine phosphoribosyltransferase
MLSFQPPTPFAVESPLACLARIGDYRLTPDFFLNEEKYRELPGVGATAYTAQEIAAGVEALVGQLADTTSRLLKRYEGKVQFVGLRNGCQPFQAAICEHLAERFRYREQPSLLELSVASYSHENQKTGQFRIETPMGFNPQEHIAGHAVVLIDDIFDTGETIQGVSKYLDEQGATEVKTVVMIQRFAEAHYRERGIALPDFSAICHQEALNGGKALAGLYPLGRIPSGKPESWFIGMGMDNRGDNRYRRSQDLYYTT